MLSETLRKLWMVAYPDQARRRSEEAMALARTIPNHPSLAFALLFAAFLSLNLREPEQPRQNGGECIAICNEPGVAHERAWVSPIYGWALANFGQCGDGISPIRAALAAQPSMGRPD